MAGSDQLADRTPARKQSSIRFRERAELLDFLLEVAETTSGTLDLDRVLANLGSIVKEVIPYDLFAILLYNERQRGLKIRYSIGHREEVVRSLVIGLGEGITGSAGSTGQPILADDVRNDPRYLNALDAVRSELAVPMISRGKLVGVIDLQSTRMGAYKEQDQTLLQLIATRVAVSIENARLYRRVERQNRTLRTLAHLSQEFSSILALDELLRKLAQTIRVLISYDAFSILLLDPDKKVLRHRFSERFDKRVELDGIPLGKGITGASAQARQPVLVVDTLVDPRYIASHPDVRSEVAVPLIVQDRVVGVMDLESERVGFFTEEYVRLLALLAPQIASSVENARLYEELAQRERRMEDDLRAARNLQQVLLPREAPPIEGLEISVRLRPAREISGDIYDFFEYAGHYALIAFGDVSGKGAAAALYGALVSGLLRTLGYRKSSPGEVLRFLNSVLLERKVDARYVTLLLIHWEAKRRRFTMANAGSIPPLICSKGEIIKLNIEGVPAGLLENREYEEVVYAAEPGDVVLCFSDGITDQLNNKEQEYGKVRLQNVLKREFARPVEEIADAILAEVDEFSRGASAFDDQTLVVLKVC